MELNMSFKRAHVRDSTAVIVQAAQLMNDDATTVSSLKRALCTCIIIIILDRHQQRLPRTRTYFSTV